MCNIKGRIQHVNKSLIFGQPYNEIPNREVKYFKYSHGPEGEILVERYNLYYDYIYSPNPSLKKIKKKIVGTKMSCEIFVDTNNK